ncbi:hypothetical protein OG21DRAFT_1135423 [Imleria badia]|nr:hypothetical protein OG21DRAFT_1135423 [Imleria badia]
MVTGSLGRQQGGRDGAGGLGRCRKTDRHALAESPGVEISERPDVQPLIVINIDPMIVVLSSLPPCSFPFMRRFGSDVILVDRKTKTKTKTKNATLAHTHARHTRNALPPAALLFSRQVSLPQTLMSTGRRGVQLARILPVRTDQRWLIEMACVHVLKRKLEKTSPVSLSLGCSPCAHCFRIQCPARPSITYERLQQQRLS